MFISVHSYLDVMDLGKSSLSYSSTMLVAYISGYLLLYQIIREWHESNSALGILCGPNG